MASEGAGLLYRQTLTSLVTSLTNRCTTLHYGPRNPGSEEKHIQYILSTHDSLSLSLSPVSQDDDILQRRRMFNRSLKSSELCLGTASNRPVLTLVRFNLRSVHL